MSAAPRPRAGSARLALKRGALAGATALLAVNLWTGAPLLALWIGSRVVGEGGLSMSAVFVVVGVLAVLLFAIAHGLAWLNETYNSLTGRPPGERRLSWLRSMNAVREDERPFGGLLELIVMVSVFAAFVSFLVWFFVFAGSPLPQR